jgi:bifunctional UDP-N-acetylglucosamine pyrophosphorylase / glucosamine-1-phosphate N-acetyltransferase
MASDNNITAIVLAGGLGKRMKTNLPKVLTRVLGQDMVRYVLASLHEAGITEPVVVVGHQGDLVVKSVQNYAQFAWQKEQLGTGHAAQCAMEELKDFQGDVIITCGDTPLISSKLFRALVERRREGSYSALVGTMILEDPRSYGRIKRDRDGNVRGIVEFRDASEREREIHEVNSGTYCFDADSLRWALSKLSNDNAQGEFYLTDTISHLLKSGRSVGAYIHDDPSEFFGINDPAELSIAEEKLSKIVKSRILSAGVVLEEPATIRIEPSVEIGPRTRIRSGVILEGNTKIGAGCVIGPHVTLRNARLDDGMTITAHFVEGPEVVEKLVPAKKED